MKKVKSEPIPQFPLKTDHPIEFAFNSNVTAYFKFRNVFDTPFKRGFASLAYYRELSMATDREYLLKHLQSQKAITDQIREAFIVKSNGLNLGTVLNLVTELEKTNVYLKEKTDWVFEPDTYFKFASVVFFDATENPYDYDYDYGNRKIEIWKNDMSLNDFFLQLPMTTLLPFLKSANVNLDNYSKIILELKKIHSDNLSSVLSKITSMTSSGRN